MRRDQIEELFYGKPELQRRFTQDFPILPDVWIAYGKTADKRVELLLTPHNDSDAARLARALRERLAIDAKGAGGTHGAAERDRANRPRVLFNESVVLASLSFRELARDAMPLTDWWNGSSSRSGSGSSSRCRRSPRRSTASSRRRAEVGRADPGLRRS